MHDLKKCQSVLEIALVKLKIPDQRVRTLSPFLSCPLRFDSQTPVLYQRSPFICRGNQINVKVSLRRLLCLTALRLLLRLVSLLLAVSQLSHRVSGSAQLFFATSAAAAAAVKQDGMELGGRIIGIREVRSTDARLSMPTIAPSRRRVEVKVL